ncbi:hypothetical protein [uncultured Enterococcus sp.]|uniref:hypothetical protein n=1 Tax=uncultured Enterococcus sp. TaxID=167972 RepID=UPI002AA92A08|nr:hypothetical protein [uncultured Enterococcus sp.]
MEELVNIDGAQQCLVCDSTFRVFSDNENSVSFCPFCNSSSEKFSDRPDIEE